MPRRRSAAQQKERQARIEDVENMLRDMKVQNDWSMTQLGKEVKKRGICLFDGKEYGNELRGTLRHDQDLIVRLPEVKPFVHAKKCLIVLRL